MKVNELDDNLGIPASEHRLLVDNPVDEGLGPVVAYESNGTKDQDFSAQLTTIIAAKPDFIFVPENYNQVALIIPQARDLGYKGPFMGSDSWGTPDLVKLCGEQCNG